MDAVDIVVAAAVIAGIVQVVKVAFLPDRFAGLFALLLGAVAGVLALVDGGVVAGIIAGLTASGAYSTSKNTVQG